MGAKTSQAMHDAERLIRAGMSTAQAARTTGLTPDAIVKTTWYRILKNLPIKEK